MQETQDKKEAKPVYEAGLEFPRWISGEEALCLFRKIAIKQKIDFSYVLTSEESTHSRGGNESHFLNVGLSGVLNKETQKDRGLALNVKFVHTISDVDRFAFFLIGNKYDLAKIHEQAVNCYPSDESKEFMETSLHIAKSYADEHFESTIRSSHTGGKIYSTIFGKDKIQQPQER